MTADGLDSPKGARGPAAWLARRPPLQLAALAFAAALACAWGGAGWARAHAQPPPRTPPFGAAAAAPAAARCPNGLEVWPLSLAGAERRVYSQTMQDGVLEEIFKRLGTTNKQFVEFGFDSDAYETGGGGANTRLLHAKGWRGLLLDGGHANPAINLHKAMLSPENIVDLFAEHGVPDEPDYISIDLDSCDIWLFLALAKWYRPRVVTIEYNSNFPAGSTLAWPPDCSLGWEPFKAGGHPRVMGSALGAVYLAAADAGYVVVHAVKVTDAFLVRADLAACLDVLPQWVVEARVAATPLHPPGQRFAKAEIYIDYATYRATGGDLAAAKARGAALLPHVPLLAVPGAG